ncbi:MAG TPA: hypothetical protein ENG06_01090 [Thermoplasmatales archaeon]|nr:MAG: hypothetical protein FE046_01895 [Thermoplasmata archaeon]RLF33373.1 MAG: hypothetical protein DRN07_02750 [Thermoplasmata archaeon]HDN50352.1 hypothetical protein [Thermoplasmatales archaeon]
MPLPKDLLIKRIKNEIRECRRHLKHHVVVSDEQFKRLPLEITVTLVDTPGPVWSDGKIIHKYTHKLKIIITEDYPYQTPIVRWKSTIFHPNIMTPEDGGYVCTKLLDGWNFRSNLYTFIEGLEILLSHPNPESPFETDTCTRAAEYFNKHAYDPPQRIRKRPKIIEEDDQDRQ